MASIYNFKDAGDIVLVKRLNGNFDPRVVGEYLEETRAKYHGVLTSASLLDESRDKNALLHDCFEWDDSKAAEKHRMRQASTIINMVQVTIVKDYPKTIDTNVSIMRNSPKKVDMYSSIRRGKTRPGNDSFGFVRTQDGLKDPEIRSQILTKAKRQLDYWAEKYRHLMEFDQVVQEIDKLPKKF